MKKEMYKPKYERDSYFVPSDVTWSLVAIYFIDHGMTDTVAKRLAEAIGKLRMRLLLRMTTILK